MVYRDSLEILIRYLHNTYIGSLLSPSGDNMTNKTQKTIENVSQLLNEALEMNDSWDVAEARINEAIEALQDMKPSKSLISEIAQTVNAYMNCVKSKNAEWMAKHFCRIEQLNKFLPSGSGIDSGSHILIDECKPEKIVIGTSFHHMTEGFYDGWTEHKIIVKPSFTGIDIQITGRDRNDIKDYLGEIFHQALTETI